MSQYRYKVLVVDDVDDLREIICFVLETRFHAEVHKAASGNQAFALFEQHGDFDLVVTDLKMPDGNGDELFQMIRNTKSQVPFVVVSGNHIPKTSSFYNQTGWSYLAKPFTFEEMTEAIHASLNKTQEALRHDEYLPVRLTLLKKIYSVQTPMFIRLNSQKYIKVTQENTEFNEEILKKYTDKEVSHLYVETKHVETLISEYRKKVMSEEGWKEINAEEMPDFVSMNIEFLRDLTKQLGWRDNMAELVHDNLKKVLILASQNKDLASWVHRFHKIERFGFADHCTLLALTCANLLAEFKQDTNENIKTLSFCALMHDMSLTDEQYDHKKKYLKSVLFGTNQSKDAQGVFEHPSKSAEICKNWQSCPPLVDKIIIEHHESPDGKGFPAKMKAKDIAFLSAVFILAEDFAHFFVEMAAPTATDAFLEARRSHYSATPFKDIFTALEKSLKAPDQKAS